MGKTHWETAFLDKRVWLPYTILEEVRRRSMDRLGLLLLDVITQFTKLEKRTSNYGTDVSIYRAEIHAVFMIHEHEGIHVTGLAEQLGFTKSSVSELLVKLEKKGLIKKDQDAFNQSKLSIRLTDKGKLAHKHHMAYHAELDAFLAATLSSCSEENRKFLENFLVELQLGFSQYAGKVF